MLRSFHTRLAICLLFCCCSVVNAAEMDPGAVVKQAVERVLEITTDTSIDAQVRRKRIRAVIDDHFDFATMSQSILSKNWQRATPAEKAKFVSYFSDYLEVVYYDNIESYTDEVIEYGATKIQGVRATVDTTIVTATKRIPVTYRLRKHRDTWNADQDRWYAYDVIIENVSLINSYRRIFSEIVADSGIEGLLKDVKRRIDAHKAKKSEN